MSYPIAATVIVAQGPTNLTISSGIDLTGNTSVSCLLRDEAGDIAAFVGAVSGAASAGKILVTIPNSTFDIAGYWTGEGQYVFSSGTYVGLPFALEVINRLT